MEFSVQFKGSMAFDASCTEGIKLIQFSEVQTVHLHVSFLKNYVFKLFLLACAFSFGLYWLNVDLILHGAQITLCQNSHISHDS
jgi:hypothetical protein